MFRRPSSSPRSGRRASRPTLAPACEALESRVVLNAAGASATLHAARVATHGHHTPNFLTPSLGTISGQVFLNTTGKGAKNVLVELIDANGNLSQATSTNRAGQYSFHVSSNGAYVVREVTPKGYTQTGPAFSNAEPTGTYAAGAGSSSWNYTTGNSNPANGPVGPANWATIAPEGSLPFESPVNLTGPTIDLGQVLSINYAAATPSQVVNNSHQIQVQFAAPAAGATPADSVTLGGVPYTLAQFHYHDPAENLVNGYAYTMEEHFVNTSADGGETVLGVFLQLGAHNNALDPILNAASASLTQANSKTPGTTAINFAGLLPASMQGWFYPGSLTTPPLSQVVNFLVFSTPITLDFAQLKQYEAVASGSGFLPNARPQQPLDGRQFNEVDYDVNFAGASLSGLNFGLAPAGTAGAATSLGSSNPVPLGVTGAAAQVISNLTGNPRHSRR